MNRVGKPRQKARPLRWYGGKSGRGLAEWVAGLLPWRKDSTYVETHGGMAGVMSAREPVRCEIYNDIDSRLSNWWRAWRVTPDDMIRMVVMTPHSREEYEIACDLAYSSNPIEAAWAFHVVVGQAIFASPQFGKKKSWKSNNTGKIGSPGKWDYDRCLHLIERFKNVWHENQDAVVLLSKLAHNSNAVIYVDPPYHSTKHSEYTHDDRDIQPLTEVLLRQDGQVAVSGYADEWDHLGWERYEFATQFVHHGSNHHLVSEPRVEVLWTNYDAYEHGSAYQSEQVEQEALFSI